MVNARPVLLVEDDLVDVKTVQRAFRANEIRNPLSVVANGAEALAFLRRHAASAEEDSVPALILLDLNMPVMNGLELLRALKVDKQLRIIPVVILTTSAEESDVATSYALGAAGYFVKPVEFQDFLEMVDALKSYWTMTRMPGGQR